ncbi:unnamed protein product, partial [Closterium sp. Naga37s-1]
AAGIVSDDFLLYSPNSTLCSVNLTDIVNASSLYRCMDHAQKSQLVAMLPAVDTANGSASVESMFRSKTFLRAVKNFQKLLAQGMFDASSLPADTAHLFSSLTSTSCLDLSASGWWQRWGQAHASSASVSHPPPPAPAPTPPTPTPPPPPPQPSPPPPTPPAAASPAVTAAVIAPSVSAAAAAAIAVSAVAVPSTISPAPVTAAGDSRSSTPPSPVHTPPAVPAPSALSTAVIIARGSTAAGAASGAGADSPSGAPSASTVGTAAAGGHSGGQGMSHSLGHPRSASTASGPSPSMSTVPSSSPSAGSALRKCTTATASTTGPTACSSMDNGVAAADAAARVFSGVSGSQKKPPPGAQAMAAPGVGAGHKSQRIPAVTATTAVSIPTVSATTGALAVPAHVTGMTAMKAAVVIPVQEQQQAGRKVAPVVPAGLGVGTGKVAEAKDEDEEDGSFAAVCGHVKVPQQPNRNQASRDPSHFALSANFFSGSSLLSASPPTGTTTPSPPPFHTSVLPSNSTHPSSSTSPGSFPRVNQSASVTPAAAAPSSHGANTWQKLAAAAAAARPAVSTAAPAAATSVSGKGGIATSISSRRPLGMPPPGATSVAAVPAAWASGASRASDLGTRYTLGEGVLNGRLIVARSVDMYSDPLRDNLMWDSSSGTGGSCSVIVPHGATAMQEPLE